MLRRLFGPGSALGRFARLEDPARFAEQLGQATAHVLQLPVPEGLDPSGMSEDEFAEALLARLEEAAQAVAAEMELELFSYAAESGRAVPIFSSERAAQAFARDWVAKTGRVLPLAIGEGPVGAVVARLGRDVRLVVDPGGSHEWEPTQSQLAALVERWG